jgi:hypothetical protein
MGYVSLFTLTLCSRNCSLALFRVLSAASRTVPCRPESSLASTTRGSWMRQLAAHHPDTPLRVCGQFGPRDVELGRVLPVLDCYSSIWCATLTGTASSSHGSVPPSLQWFCSLGSYPAYCKSPYSGLGVSVTHGSGHIPVRRFHAYCTEINEVLEVVVYIPYPTFR